MNHETFQFVRTPSCRLCIPNEGMKKRFSCIGCTKTIEIKPAPPVHKNRKLRKIGQQKRDEKILCLKKCGLSLGDISILMKLPRSTVFNAVKRASLTDAK